MAASALTIMSILIEMAMAYENEKQACQPSRRRISEKLKTAKICQRKPAKPGVTAYQPVCTSRNIEQLAWREMK